MSKNKFTKKEDKVINDALEAFIQYKGYKSLKEYIEVEKIKYLLMEETHDIYS